MRHNKLREIVCCVSIVESAIIANHMIISYLLTTMDETIHGDANEKIDKEAKFTCFCNGLAVFYLGILVWGGEL